MGFFWFIIVIVLLIVITRRKAPPTEDDQYAQGYWDGFRAAGDRIGDVLSHEDVSREALQAIINEGHGGMATQAVTASVADVVPAEVVDTEPWTAEAPAAASAPALSPAERSLRNLNTLLYMASFLLVAAATAFVAAAMPADVRLVGLISVVVLFYGTGMVLHHSVRRLRPAAIAFIGTGLAILPFVGVALHLLGGVPEAIAWFIISLVGLVAYAIAAVVLQSQVVSYLTMAFVLSLVSSAVATASLPLVWYFVGLIGVSLLANTLSFLWPQRIPELFRLPVEQTGQVVTPLAVVASFLIGNQMTIRMYELLFLVVAAHYLVVWLQQRQYWQLAVVRGLLHVTALIGVWDITAGNMSQFAIWWLVLAAVQAGISLLSVRLSDEVSVLRERLWLIISAGLMLFAVTLWTGDAHPARGVTASLVLLGLLAASALFRLRELWWAYVGLSVSVVLPFVVGRWLAVPAWSWSVLIGCFTALAVAALVAHYLTNDARRSERVVQFFAVATVVYGVLIVLSGIAAGDAVTTGWALMLAAAVYVTLSYTTREFVLEPLGAVLGVVALFLWISQSSIASSWQLTTSIGLSVGLLAAGTVMHHLRGETERRTTLLALGMVMTIGLVGNVGQVYPTQYVADVSVILLLVATVASLLLRARVSRTHTVLQALFTGGYFTYLILAWVASWLLHPGWQVLVFAVAVVIFWVGSYLERLPYLTIAGNLALVLCIARLWMWLRFDPTWTAFGVAWLAAGLLYGVYWLLVERGDRVRQWISVGSVWAILGCVSLFQFFDFSLLMRVSAAGSIIAIGATLGIHGYLLRKRDMIEAAVYVVTFGMQRIVGLAIPELDVVFYAHWWALVLGLVAYWRGVGQRLVRLIIAMAMLSLAVGGQALVDSGYQLLFLTEHLALLVAGVVYRRQWAVWWGIAASVLAVLYFLRDYTFLWLGFLGLVLIGIVVWRLVRNSVQSESK